MGEQSYSCLAFLQFLCCGTIRGDRKAASKLPDSKKVKIRIGFKGKDTLMDPNNLNVKAVFGSFAVLLDYSNNHVIPLNSEGFVVEPLDPRKRYVVVVNTHGSSKIKWDMLRVEGKNGKGKHKHSKKHKKSSKSTKSKKDESKSKGDKEMKIIVSGIVDDFTSKDFAAASTQHLLTPNSTPNNGEDDIF